MEMYVHINTSIGKGLCGKRLAWGRGVGNVFFFYKRFVFLREDYIFVVQHKDGYYTHLPKFRKVRCPGYYLDAPGRTCMKMLKCPGTAEGLW